MFWLLASLILCDSINKTDEIPDMDNFEFDDFNETDDDLNYSSKYQHFYDDEDINFSTDSIVCTAPNSHKNLYGYCECDEGYYGDPDSSEGCYKCTENCTKYALCVYPGICQCMHGYIGNGTNHCELSIPKIISVSPNSTYSQGSILVNVTYSFDFSKPYSAYCKFGVDSVVADFITDAIIGCRAPLRAPQIVPFSISFDGIHYSKEKVNFEYQNPFSFVSVLNLSIMYICIIAGITGCLFVVLRGKGQNQDIPTKDEKEPFIIDPENPNKKKKKKPKIPRRGY